MSEKPDEILEGRLFLSSMHPALNEDVLKAHNITHIVNATNRCVPNAFEGRVSYLNVDLDDAEESRLEPHFRRTFDFISGAEDENGQPAAVLVHCMCGVSRSATLVISYLMMSETKLSARQAFEWTKARRSVVAPNPTFASEILALEKVLGYSDTRSIEVDEMVGKNYHTAKANAAQARQALDSMGGGTSTSWGCVVC